MSDSFVLENEAWFQKMIETKEFPAMMVPPRMGEHPVGNGRTVRWVKTFWQEMRERYGLSWPQSEDGGPGKDASPEDEGEPGGVGRSQWAVCPNCRRMYGDLAGICYWCQRLEGRQVALILTDAVTSGSW